MQWKRFVVLSKFVVKRGTSVQYSILDQMPKIHLETIGDIDNRRKVKRLSVEDNFLKGRPLADLL